MINRILVLLDHTPNSNLLARALEPHYEIMRPVAGRLPAEPFDLAIVDDRAMARLRLDIQARREAEKPFFLPVIFVTSRQGMKLITRQVWQAVDDLLVTPTERAELLARIRIHLRARYFSLELKARNEALRKLDMTKDQFLSIVSHELRTPLNAIMGFGSVLEDELLGPLNAEQHRCLQKMLEGSEHLLALVEDLLEMSRIQAGKLRLELAPTDITGLIDRNLAGISSLAEKKRQRLSSQVRDGLPPVWADQRRLSQVLINLLQNAIKFTPEGGSIQVRAALAGDHMRIEVQDTGIGIAEAEIPNLFQRFSQLDTSFTREAGGTGLGLAISKGLVEAHGGEIGVTSEPGQGSTFWLSLPLLGGERPA